MSNPRNDIINLQKITRPSSELETLQKNLSPITDTARLMPLDQMSQVFGETFVQNMRHQIASQNRTGYSVHKTQIYKLVSDLRSKEAELSNEWGKFSGKAVDPEQTKNGINGTDYWNSIVASVRDALVPSETSAAFSTVEIQSLSPSQAYDLAARVRDDLKAKTDDEKTRLSAAAKTHGEKVGLLKEQLENRYPQQPDEPAKAYKSRINALVNGDPELSSSNASRQAISDSYVLLNTTFQKIDALAKRAETIQAKADAIRAQKAQCNELAQRVDPSVPQRVINAIETLLDTENDARTTLMEQFKADPQSVSRRDFIQSEINHAKELYAEGVVDYVGFLQNIVESDNITVSFPQFHGVPEQLFQKRSKAVIDSNDGYVVLALASATPETFAVDDGLKLFEDRAKLYTHVSNVHGNIVDNPYLHISDAQRNRHNDDMAAEMLYSTLFPHYTIEIRLGLGGSTLGQPLGRLMAYPASSISLIQGVVKANEGSSADNGLQTNVPQLMVFSADKISSLVNGFSSETAEKTGQANLNFLENGVELLYGSDIARHIHFKQVSKQDVQSDPTIQICQNVGSRLADLYLNHIDRFESLVDAKTTSEKEVDDDVRLNWHLSNDERQIVSTLGNAGISVSSFGRAVFNMGKRALKHAASENNPGFEFTSLPFDQKEQFVKRGMAYAAFHSSQIVFADLAVVGASTQFAQQPTKVIKIGGMGEESFNVLQRATTVLCLQEEYKNDRVTRRYSNIVALNNPSQRPSHLTCTSGGNPPPYYQYNSTDLLLSDCQNPDGIQQTIPLLEKFSPRHSVYGDWLTVREELERQGIADAAQTLASAMLWVGQVPTTKPQPKSLNL